MLLKSSLVFLRRFQQMLLLGTWGPAIVVKYIRHMYEGGSSYSTVNFHRSSISKFHVGYNGVSVGVHPLVSQAVKSSV